MIISGGVNIYPQELESALLELADIAEVAVIGAPDPDFGEKPVAFVVPRDPAADPALLRERIEAWATRRLGRIKRPRDIRLVASLPYSAQGKLLRRELRKALTP
jgi:fatty-acyl-CoA synthase